MKKPDPLKSLTITVNDSLIRKTRAASFHAHMTVSAWVRTLLRDYFESGAEERQVR